MLNRQYTDMLEHYFDVINHKETNEMCLDLLEEVDISQFAHYYYQIELIGILEKCLAFTKTIECIAYARCLEQVTQELEECKEGNK